MFYTQTGGIRLGQYNILHKHKESISHFVTTRDSDFNLSLNNATNPQTVLENRKQLAQAVGINPEDFIFPIQVHGTHIQRVNSKHRSLGALSTETAIANTDGLITNVPGICLMTMAADCVSLLFYDPVNSAIGAAHAGWKGTVQKIAAHTVQRMQQEFGTNPQDLIVAIGPSAGPCCYEVGPEVIEQVLESFEDGNVVIHHNNKTIFNLWEANRIALIESGVLDENIELSEICTLCHSHSFYSARKGDSGRFASGILLR